MEKASVVKQAIVVLVESYLGAPTAKTFSDFYRDETLPIYTDGALKILEDIVGREKARTQIQAIFREQGMEGNYV